MGGEGKGSFCCISWRCHRGHRCLNTTLTSLKPINDLKLTQCAIFMAVITYLLETTHYNSLGLVWKGWQVFGTNQSRSLWRCCHATAGGLLGWWVSAASGKHYGANGSLAGLPYFADKSCSDRKSCRRRKEIKADISAPSPHVSVVFLLPWSNIQNLLFPFVSIPVKQLLFINTLCGGEHVQACTHEINYAFSTVSLYLHLHSSCFSLHSLAYYFLSFIVPGSCVKEWIQIWGRNHGWEGDGRVSRKTGRRLAEQLLGAEGCCFSAAFQF